MRLPRWTFVGASLVAATGPPVDPVLTSRLTDRAVVDRVDEVFQEEWERQGLTPGEHAAELTVMRRLALALTGALSAKLGGARWAPAVARLVFGGALAMAVTYGIGQLVGAAGI